MIYKIVSNQVMTKTLDLALPQCQNNFECVDSFGTVVTSAFKTPILIDDKHPSLLMIYNHTNYSHENRIEKSMQC